MGITVATVIAHMHAYGIAPEEEAWLQPLSALHVSLPDDLRLGAVRSALSQAHVSLPDPLLRKFRDHALYLSLEKI